MDTAISLVVPILATASIYVLIAVSLNLIYAPSNVLNFGQGDLVAFGGLLGAAVYVRGDLPLVLAVVLVAALGAVIGGITYALGASRFMQGGSGFGWLLGTLGVAVILENVNTHLWGTEPVAFSPLFGLGRSAFGVGSLVVTPSQLVVIVFAIVVVVTVEGVSRLTRFGWALQAVSQDREAAAIRGLPVRTLTLVAFCAGAALAAVSGFVTAPLTQAWAFLGFGLLLKAFTVMVIGGVGRNVGAAIAAVGLAAAESYGTLWIPLAYRDAIVLVLLLIVLVVRPQGLFGVRGARAV